MEKAILKTLAYADIFDYPLKAYEIHKWLIGTQATLRQVEKALNGLSTKKRLNSQKGYFFLPKRTGLVRKRQLREKQSLKYLAKARLLTAILKVIPWIKLMGVSGGLAMGNASRWDDIDLFIVTSKNRLWISRLLGLSLLSLTRQRRKVGDKGRKIAGKLCLNILLEEDRLEQNNKDIYLAHEVLQMQVLWQKDGIYKKYLEDNQWAFKFLPNWTATSSSPRMRGSNKQRALVFNWIPVFAGMAPEKMAQWLQLKIMGKPQGMERIEAGAVYFHPNDIRPKVLLEYKQKVRDFSRA